MATLVIDAFVHADDLARALRADVRRGLTSSPKELPPKWFYDERGSELFDAITRLPEYYPTRRERSILVARTGEIAARTGADTLVELGSGTSDKTRLLLDAMYAAGQLRRFVPFDVSEPPLRAASASIARTYAGVDVHAIVGDFDQHIAMLPNSGRRMVAFLGGTIGNMGPARRATFLRELRDTMHEGEHLLLGTDLVKDRDRLVAAYDDAAGVTAAFNRNVLHVINTELAGTFVPERFAHVARWDDENEWIEMRLRSLAADQTVSIGALGLTVEFAAGEEMRTEISAKFRRPRVEAELIAAGWSLEAWWTDQFGDFAVSLARAT
jgi:L-histidine Nalpha-methyltransferase